MNYYRRYVGDYLRDTASLSLCEHGAYCLLLDYAYATEKPIPAERDEVMRLVRAFTGEERKAVGKVLDRFWILEDDGHHNPRVDDELEKAVKLIDKQKANGSLGGRPKKTQTITQDETQTITQNNQPPTTNHQPPASNLQPPTESTPASPARANGKKKPGTPLPDGFDISDKVSAWATREGYRDLSTHLESFVNKCRAKDYRYANWDSAFMEAIRADWAGVNKGARH